MRGKKKRSGFEKLTMIVVWVMIVLTLGGVVLAALQPLNLF
ncbi:DUF4044 domain-containing protein [Furfurilactobacillus curtus]|uniref:DUF4044 domain-containing protein n=1 Tax=Furfurilactobacillus curtus TaxID=1746200 RepID=A0ABQ5JLG6_9LACO